MRLDAHKGRTGAPEDLDTFKSNSEFYAAAASWAVIGQNRGTDSPVASLGGRGTLGRIEVEVAVARVDRRRAARRARFVDKRTAAWARIALMWVRKRCYEPTEPPRSLETARACRNS